MSERRAAERTEDAAARLQGWLAERGLRPGDRVPAERDIAASLGMPRPRIREALRQLTARGLLVQTSPRIRLVPGSPDDGGLGAGAIVVLTTIAPSAPHATQYQIPEVYTAVVEAITARSRPALTMPPAMFAARLDVLATQRPAGLIVLEDTTYDPGTAAIIASARRLGIPTVVHGDALPQDHWLDLPCERIGSDHHRGAVELCRWLGHAGARRILPVFIAAEGMAHWRCERELGLADGAAEIGAVLLPKVELPPGEWCDGSAESFRRNVLMRLGFLHAPLTGPGRPDAIACPSDGELPFIAHAARLLGLDPARDLILVGYDHYWDQLSYRVHEPTPPRASIDKDARAVGRALVERLLRRPVGDQPDPGSLAVPPRLVETASG